MYVKVRTMDGKQEAILTISKLTEVEDFKVYKLGKYINIYSNKKTIFLHINLYSFISNIYYIIYLILIFNI